MCASVFRGCPDKAAIWERRRRKLGRTGQAGGAWLRFWGPALGIPPGPSPSAEQRKPIGQPGDPARDRTPHPPGLAWRTSRASEERGV